ncbi:MAG TPA: urea amidolyase, partial [Dietzia sp.]|nr:urea amidolyase [Dietzia sp.]
MSLMVLRAGPSALIQDLGRPGHASLGVTASGAADRAAAALALRCLGTDPGAAVLEVLLGGLVVMTDTPVVVAVTGARGLVVVTTSSGSRRLAATGEVLRLEAGSTLEIGRPVAGLRSYLGVRGGIDAPPVLGSRSRDTLSGLGPPPVVAGDVLGVGDRVVGPWAEHWHAAGG